MASVSQSVLLAAVATAFREFRLEAGLSFEDVWAETGLPPEQVEEIEAQARQATFMDALLLADAYGIPVEAFHQRARAIEGDWLPARSGAGE